MGMLAWLPKPSRSEGPEAEITDSIRGAGANATDITAAIGLRGLSLGDLLALAGPRLSPPTGSPLDGVWPSRVLKVELAVPPVSNGQFVWGPNVGSFDPRAFLRGKGSSLADYGDDVALWASYSSVNPKLLLATLEYRYGLVDAIPPEATADDVRGMIEDTAVTLATAYYEHLSSWGEGRSRSRPPAAAPAAGL